MGDEAPAILYTAILKRFLHPKKGQEQNSAIIIRTDGSQSSLPVNFHTYDVICACETVYSNLGGQLTVAGHGRCFDNKPSLDNVPSPGSERGCLGWETEEVSVDSRTSAATPGRGEVANLRSAQLRC